LSDDAWWDSPAPDTEPDPDPYGQGRRRSGQQPGRPAAEHGRPPYGQPYPQTPPQRPEQRVHNDYPTPRQPGADEWSDPRGQSSGGQRGARRAEYGGDPYADPRSTQGRPPRPADPYASGSQDPYTSGSHRSGGREGYTAPYGAEDPRRGQRPDPYGSERGGDAYGGPAQYGGEGGRRRGTGSHERPDLSGTQQRPAAEPGGGGGRRRRAGASPNDYPAEAARSGSYETDSYGARPRPADPYDTGSGSYKTAPREPSTYDADAYETRGRSRRRGVPDPAEEFEEPRQRRRPSVTDQDEDYDRLGLMDDGEGEGEGGRGRKGKQKRGRNCLAVFIAFCVLAGGLGYGGYKAYTWYQGKYGAPPDFASTTGDGTKVDVTIPSGAGGTQIGGILFDDGIVKSQRAFVEACDANSRCSGIFAGTYLLPKEISGAAAVDALLNPSNQDSKTKLITFGGERAATIFAQLETKTGWKDSDILAAVDGGKIDLPAWDTGKAGAKVPYAHIEGFIASETYDLKSYPTPAALLKKMVDDQLAVFTQEDLAAKAKAVNESEYDVLIIASMARAEAGTNTADLNKIAGVIYNRLKNTADFAHLGFDTVTLYGMGNSTTVPDNADRSNPYNTSVNGIVGLPPSPIDNPDQPSIDAALNPTDNTDFYFCATNAGVQYAVTNAQWQALGKRYPGLCG
jgi:UPF0755 protein